MMELNTGKCKICGHVTPTNEEFDYDMKGRIALSLGHT